MTKLQFRRTWFQVHKWIGLVLAILIIPLSLSGSLLVWDQPLDRLLNPARYAVSGVDSLPPRAYVTAAGKALAPGARIATLTYPEGKGPVVLQASLPGSGERQAGPPARTSVWLDPPTARVLGVADSRSGPLRVIHMLHGSLLVPGIGRRIVGWIGVAMMISCFTGLWLWWPTVGKWARGLRWGRHRNFDTNLHHLMGFWIALPLFVLSLTGAWIALPGIFGGGRPAGPPTHGRAQPIAQTARAPDAVLTMAQAASPGPVRSIGWPSEGKTPRWSVEIAGRAVSIGDRKDTVSTEPVSPHGGTGIAGAMRRLHDGDGMGPLWQAIIFIGGILPAALAMTGIIMWWRARNWRGELTVRRREVRAGRR